MTVHTTRRWGRRPATRGESFQRLKRHQGGLQAVKVMPGGYYVTTHVDEVMVTVLGSCVAACIRDPELGIAGMNHFMLPAHPRQDIGSTTERMRYGVHAMEVLINELLASGSRREGLEVKVFGGANMRSSAPASTEIGSENVAFVSEYLSKEGMAVAAEHLGGGQPRRIHYYPATGKVRMLLLDRIKSRDLARDEEIYRHRLRRRPRAGDTDSEPELF